MKDLRYIKTCLDKYGHLVPSLVNAVTVEQRKEREGRRERERKGRGKGEHEIEINLNLLQGN